MTLLRQLKRTNQLMVSNKINRTVKYGLYSLRINQQLEDDKNLWYKQNHFKYTFEKKNFYITRYNKFLFP